MQPDGKILAGGSFTHMGIVNTRNRMARFGADGLLDGLFAPSFNGIVQTLAVQPDGKIVVGGMFTSMAGGSRSRIGRLLTNGALDTGFNPDANGTVQTLCLLPDGALLAGGNFTMMGGRALPWLARISATGVVQTNFNAQADGPVMTLAAQPDGKILVGGSFTTIGGQPRENLARLLADGSADPDFNPGADGPVRCLVQQADGSVLLGGAFTHVGGAGRDRLARVRADGTLDEGFNPGADGEVLALALTADGYLFAGGNFTQLGTLSRSRIGRLDPTGAVDVNFSPAVNGDVQALAVQADGAVLTGGAFTSLGGKGRTYLGRLPGSAATVNHLAMVAGRIYWQRGGGEPEVHRTTFEYSTDRTVWSALGAGTRVSGGWEWTGVTAKPGSFRARGFTSSGQQAASGGMVETIIGAPLITLQPANVQSNAGLSPSLSVTALGTSPMTYEWRRDSAILSDDTDHQGATTSRLTILGALEADEGNYTVVIRNTYGSVTSAVARLTVVDPTVNSQPVGGTLPAGDLFILSAQVGGTGPITYQWEKDAIPLEEDARHVGVHTNIMQVLDVSGEDSGLYRLVARSAHGSVTSQVATLVVNDPAIRSQPVMPAVVPGGQVQLSVGASGSNLRYRWRKDGADLPAPGDPTLLLSNIQPSDAGVYDVVVCSPYGCVTSLPVELLLNGVVVDSGFVPEAHNYTIDSISVQADRRFLISGKVDDGRRFHFDGTRDASFPSRSSSGTIYGTAVLANDQLVTFGNFSAIDNPGTPSHLYRTDSNGLLDLSFAPDPNERVYTCLELADGSMFVAGYFSALQGQSRNRLARLNPDGSPQPAFLPPTNTGNIQALACLPDGKLLVGGIFSYFDGVLRPGLVRLHANGAVDTSFVTGKIADGMATGVYSLVVQPDGKILIAGDFYTINGIQRPYIARLNSDGSLDMEFNPAPNKIAYALALQADGKILVGGKFTTIGGWPRTYLARLHPDGRPDATFAPNPNDFVYALNLLPGGNILTGGDFTSINGAARSKAARLANNNPSALAFTVQGGGLQWARGGGAPEVWRTTFEKSPDGVTWTRMGSGVRVSGGWSLPEDPGPGAHVRARGFASFGYRNASTAVHEMVISPPVIVQQPPSLRSQTGQPVTLTAIATGPAPLQYRWTKNGVPVVNDANHAGADSSSLTIHSVTDTDAGAYQLRVSTASGAYDLSTEALLSGVGLDTDADGIPDWWTQLYFGHPTGREDDLSRPDDDASGTGHNNRFKYIAGLSPTDPAARFQIDARPAPGAPGHAQVVFSPRMEGRQYRIFKADALLPSPVWTEMTPSAVTDVGSERRALDPEPAESQQFYRIEITLP